MARERRALEILEEALERPEREREGFIHQTCGDDDALHRRVMELLGTSSGGGSFEEPLFDIHNSEPLTEKEIGPYRLLNALGRGGMGIIYLAERKDFEQKVAIKVIRHGLDLDPVLVRRFHNERQILARLEHPHIARLLDGGTTRESLPYFVMEYVEGEPIDRFCQSRNLSLRERLLLFQKVCAAVQFAHRNLVIHRDLKPGNILITDQGEPKLLDFGIAKLLDDNLMAAPLATATGQGPMTPRYASPEQVRTEAITTASDVYSLGVLLYELLTGVSPYRVDTANGYELGKAVCEQRPKRPSTASISLVGKPVSAPVPKRSLRGDLDSILLKALQKKPEERYGSVEKFQEDLGNYLLGQAVEARQGNWVYRFVKFARRSPFVVSAVAAFLILATTFGLVSRWLLQESEISRQEALIQRELSSKTILFVQQLFEDVGPDATGGPSLSTVELLQRGKEKVLSASLEDPALEAEFAGTLAELFRSLGKTNDAQELLEWAVAAARKAYPSPHSEIIKHLQNLTVLHYDHDQLDVAEKAFRDLLEQRIQIGHPENKLFRLRSNLASVLLRQGKLEEAEAIYLNVYERRRELYEIEFGPDDKDIATSRHNLAALYLEWNQLDKAEAFARRAIQSRRKSDVPSKVAASLDLLGRILLDKGKMSEARQKIEEALSIRQRILETGHSDIAKSQSNLSETWIDDDLEAAENLLLAALEAFRKKEDQRFTASSESILGLIHLKKGNLETASKLLEDSYQQLESTSWPESRLTRKALARLQQYQQQTDQNPFDS